MNRLRSFFNPARLDASGATRVPLRVFWVGFLVRLAYMTLAHTYRFAAVDGHFPFGWEAGRIGQALATGYGFADPFSNFFQHHTGPTAWLPPLYPLLVGAVFKVFGVFTNASAWALLAINCAAAGATGLCVWELGERLFSARCGRWAGWVWALCPVFFQFPTRWVWDVTLSTLVLSMIFVLAVRMADRRGVRDWLTFGLLWGLLAMLNSSLLIFLPWCGLWVLWRRREWAGAASAGMVFGLCLVPWATRNWITFHAFIPLRGNLGAEMDRGNGPGSEGYEMAWNHPFMSVGELRAYTSLGEVRYDAARGREADAYMRAKLLHLLADSAKRGFFYWAGVPHASGGSAVAEWGRLAVYSFASLCGLLGIGLAVWRRVPGVGLLAGAFLLLPLPYYLVVAHAKFRHPLEPLICVVGVYLFQSAERG